jgi:hypothetical protein
MNAAQRISAQLRDQLLAYKEPVVVLDEQGAVIFGNTAWIAFQRRNRVPAPYGIGSRFECFLPIDCSTAAGLYERAAVEQGLSEVLEGAQQIFCKECVSLCSSTPKQVRYKLTVTPCQFVDSGLGAIIWSEVVSGSCKRHRFTLSPPPATSA